MPCSSISIVDFEHEFICLLVISLVSILTCLNFKEFKGTIMQI